MPFLLNGRGHGVERQCQRSLAVILGAETLFPLARARAARTKPRFIEIDRYGERLTGCIECNRGAVPKRVYRRTVSGGYLGASRGWT